ncbi:MAG TPA: hypothetical protein VHC69_15060 [Polyangiaceae bacterium]|nr:hypothetical protein [Polyangiaceae bacterium]
MLIPPALTAAPLPLPPAPTLPPLPVADPVFDVAPLPFVAPAPSLPPSTFWPLLCDVVKSLPLHAVVLTAAAANATSAARPSRTVGNWRSGAPETSLVTTTPQKGHVASLRRMCLRQPAQFTKLVMVVAPAVSCSVSYCLLGGAP